MKVDVGETPLSSNKLHEGEDDLSVRMTGTISRDLNAAYSAASAGHEDFDDTDFNGKTSKPRLTEACAPGGFYEVN